MVLHANRGGLIDMATYTNGTRVNPDPYTWAGLQSPLYPRYASHARGTQWLGSLVANKHDGSGLVYMRNRYLNPQTGQFTQTDPIGLAGGLNLYGYAGGDPVNFHDPFGLKLRPIDRQARRYLRNLERQVRAGLRSDDSEVRAVAGLLNGMIQDLRSARETFYISVQEMSGTRRDGALAYFQARPGVRGGAIIIDPTHPGLTKTGVPPEVGLAHEMGHAWDHMNDPDRIGTSHTSSNNAADVAEYSARVLLGCSPSGSHESGGAQPCE